MYPKVKYELHELETLLSPGPLRPGSYTILGQKIKSESTGIMRALALEGLSFHEAARSNGISGIIHTRSFS
jgi:hypothetical protein